MVTPTSVPRKNFLYNWTVSALVLSVDLETPCQGGKLLAYGEQPPIAGKPSNRLGLPFVKNYTCSGDLRSH